MHDGRSEGRRRKRFFQFVVRPLAEFLSPVLEREFRGKIRPIDKHRELDISFGSLYNVESWIRRNHAYVRLSMPSL
jgi:hypothetical protein